MSPARLARIGLLLSLCLGGACDVTPATPPATAPDLSGSAAETAPLPPVEAIEVVTGGAVSADKLPLILAIHGLGDNPRSFSGIAANWPFRSRVLFLRGLTPYHGGFAWFGIDRESPERMAPGIARAADAIAAAIPKWTEAHPTIGKPIVTGFSQGGMLSYALFIRHPALFSAVLPIAGALPPSLWPTEKRDALPPLQAMHGESDTLVPFSRAKDLHAAFDRLGIPATLIPFPGVKHTITPEMSEKLATTLERALPRESP